MTLRDSTPHRRRRDNGDVNDVRVENTAASWGWFGVWLVVGGGYATGLLGAAAFGLFVLPIPIIGTVFLVRQKGSSRGMAGLISGLSVPLFVVAYRNRPQPGLDGISPWPW